MKKIFKIALLICIAVVAAYIIKFYFYRYHYKVNPKVLDRSLSFKIKYKDLKGAVDFTSDEKGNYYIAYKSKIQVIDKTGRSYNIIENENFDISSIDYKDGKLYYASKDKIYCYDIIESRNTEFFSGIPNYGDYNKSIVKINGNYLYVSIGAATNSGVVGKDNMWNDSKTYVHDITPSDITLKGINFENGTTGAFQSYGTRSIKGQVIPSHFPGNASIIFININTKKASTFAWGIRNVLGMDFNFENKLFCSVGGMENRGARPVSGDNDYIYEIEKGVWYGWPDYSGGDPITSPKFKGKNGLSFLLENHPNMNPPSPIYQSLKASSLGSIAVDSLGNIGEKNCIFFYNSTDNLIYNFKYPKVEKSEIKFGENSLIKSMKIYGKSLLILDSKSGYMYSINKKDFNNIKDLKQYNNVYVYLILSAIVAIILVLKVKRD
jgi:hypothetical protein